MNSAHKKLFFIVAFVGLAAAALFLVNLFKNREIKKYKVGILDPIQALIPAEEGFRAGMAMLGYKEGEDIEFIKISPALTPEDARMAVGKLIDAGVDMIYTAGVIATKAAHDLTESRNTNTPVVFAVVSDPVGNKLVQSRERSGNNLAGIDPLNEKIVTKRLNYMIELSPGAKRVLMLWNNPVTSGIENLREAAQQEGIDLFERKVESAEEIDNFLETFRPRQGDVMLRSTDAVSATRVKELIQWAKKNKIPLAGTNRGDVKAGAFMSYGANYYEIGLQAARLADRIFKGDKPTDIPIQTPDTLEVVVNTETMKLLGIELTTKARTIVNTFVP